MTITAQDLLDRDLTKSAAFALVAKDVMLLLDDSVEELDVTTLIDALAELRALGFTLAREADVKRREASTWVVRAGKSLRASRALAG